MANEKSVSLKYFALCIETFAEFREQRELPRKKNYAENNQTFLPNRLKSTKPFLP